LEQGVGGQGAQADGEKGSKDIDAGSLFLFGRVPSGFEFEKFFARRERDQGGIGSLGDLGRPGKGNLTIGEEMSDFWGNPFSGRR